jgi:hypothetical protein
VKVVSRSAWRHQNGAVWCPVPDDQGSWTVADPGGFILVLSKMEQSILTTFFGVSKYRKFGVVCEIIKVEVREVVLFIARGLTGTQSIASLSWARFSLGMPSSLFRSYLPICVYCAAHDHWPSLADCTKVPFLHCVLKFLSCLICVMNETKPKLEHMSFCPLYWHLEPHFYAKSKNRVD